MKKTQEKYITETQGKGKTREDKKQEKMEENQWTMK